MVQLTLRPGASGTEPVSIPYFFLPGQRNFYLIGSVVFVGTNLLLLTLGGLLLRSRLNRLADPLSSRPLLTVGVGMGSLILFGFLEEAVSPLSYGETLTDLMGVILLLALWAGYSALSWKLGELFVSGKSHWMIFLIGAAVSTLLLMVPVVDLFAFILLPIFSTGCVVLSGLGSHPDWLCAKVPWTREGKRLKTR